MRNLDRMLREEHHEEKLNSDRLKPRHFAISYEEGGLKPTQNKHAEPKRQSLLMEREDVFHRLSKMQQERWKAHRVPRATFKPNLVPPVKNPEGVNLSPYQKRKATSEG